MTDLDRVLAGLPLDAQIRQVETLIVVQGLACEAARREVDRIVDRLRRLQEHRLVLLAKAQETAK